MNNIDVVLRDDGKTTWHTSHMSTIAVAMFFAMIGLDKFTSGWVEVFTQIGFGQWFRYFTGCVQLTGAALMIVRRTTFVGVFILACTMIGAMIAQIRVLEGPGAAVIPGSLLAVLLIVAGIEISEWRERRDLA